MVQKMWYEVRLCGSYLKNQMQCIFILGQSAESVVMHASPHSN